MPAGGSRSLSTDAVRAFGRRPRRDRRPSRRGHRKQWAAPDAPLGLFTYEVFDSGEYEGFWAHGMNPVCRDLWWPHYACGKKGLDAARPVRAVVAPGAGRRRERRRRASSCGCGCRPRRARSSAARASSRSRSTPARDGGTISFDLGWRRQGCDPRARSGMALLRTRRRRAGAWRYEKLGRRARPAERRALRRAPAQHRPRARDAGRGSARRSRRSTRLSPLSTARSCRPPNPEANGLHVNLLNTVWSTNYTQWYDDDARFRFRVRL